MPGRQSKKRKAEHVEDGVIDLSNARTDAEARQHSSSGPSTISNIYTAVTPFEELSPLSQKHALLEANRIDAAAIDLDSLPDPRPVIEIDSDDDEEILLDEEYSLHEYIGSFHTKVTFSSYKVNPFC